MELLQLKYFLTVAKLEHMTNAAQELHVSQPALSRTIHRLEEDLGVPLFERQGRQIRLNPFGKAFEAKAKAAMHLLEEGRREIEDLSGLKQGRIHLAMMNMEQMRKPLQIFLAEHSEVNFHMFQLSIEDFENLELKREVDFYLTSMPIYQEGFIEIPLVREKLYLVVPHGHKYANRKSIHLSEVSEEAFVGYKENSPLRLMNDRLCAHVGFRPKMVCETEDPASIIDLVRSGFGVAIIGGCRSEEELNLVKLPIVDPIGERIFRITWRENRYLSRAAIVFRDFIVNYFKDEEPVGNTLRKALMLR
ncbi:DNA-binding transcriptional regulator, LysR family [Seinonella peptonophila]|uniref:DNA-binding transcriptional regulator, LysR family n=1 Tax=Seinonella peptonophila TaxID=112248 RepID=A0A1M4XHR0_9BACL|nr:LysR family transcriptional regulator [Seinonella peptonophila]SHE93045.1 DNA-binding transcriptional regulator, LysR family [Seinonella peptonophila]